MSDIEKKRERKIEEGNEKREKGTIKITLHLAAAFVLEEEMKQLCPKEVKWVVGERRSKERRRNMREEEIDSWTEEKKVEEKGEEPLAAMGSESEVDKERNMDSHRRREKDRQSGSERKGRRAVLERGDKGAWKRNRQRCPVDRRVGPARRGNGAKRLL